MEASKQMTARFHNLPTGAEHQHLWKTIVVTATRTTTTTSTSTTTTNTITRTRAPTRNQQPTTINNGEHQPATTAINQHQPTSTNINQQQATATETSKNKQQQTTSLPNFLLKQKDRKTGLSCANVRQHGYRINYVLQ